MTLGCPQGHGEKVSLISRGEGRMKRKGLAPLLLNALRIFLAESCVCLLLLITLTELTIQRNKERFWQLEQTAKPKKANISLWYKSSSKGKTVLVSHRHLGCPNVWCPALAQRAGELRRAMSMQSTVTCLSTRCRLIERKLNKKQTRKTYCDYNKATSTTSAWAHVELQRPTVHHRQPELVLHYWILQMGVSLSTSTAWRPPVYTQLLRGIYMWVYTVCVYACWCVSERSSLKHNVLQALAAGGLLVSAIVEKRVDLPDGRLTVLPLRLPQQAVVGDSLCVAAFKCVVGRGRFGQRALQVHRGGDGAGCLAPVASFADSPSVRLGAAHLRLLSPLSL